MVTRVKAAIDLINKPHHLRSQHSKGWGIQPYNRHSWDQPCKAGVPELKTLAEEGSLHSRKCVYFLFLPKKCKKRQRLYCMYVFHYLGNLYRLYKIRLSILTCHINTFILHRIGHWGIWSCALIHFLLNTQQWQLYQSPMNSEAAVYFFMLHCLSPPCCLLNCKLFVAEKPLFIVLWWVFLDSTQHNEEWGS